MFIQLKEKAMEGERLPIQILRVLMCFLNRCATYKRVRKVLRNTANFDVISQAQIFEQMFFNSKNRKLSVSALKFSVEISNKKSFTQTFVEKYVHRIRKIIPTISLESSFKIIHSIFGKWAREFFPQITLRAAWRKKVQNSRWRQTANKNFQTSPCVDEVREVWEKRIIRERVSKVFSLQWSSLLRQHLSKSRLAKPQKNLQMNMIRSGHLSITNNVRSK